MLLKPRSRRLELVPSSFALSCPNTHFCPIFLSSTLQVNPRRKPAPYREAGFQNGAPSIPTCRHRDAQYGPLYLDLLCPQSNHLLDFQKRATYEQTRTTWRAVGFTLLGLLLVGLIFCIVVSILICKNKATARRRREKQDPIELAKFSEPRPTYMMVPMIVAPDQAPRELGTANRGESGRSWEVDHARPGEADGHPVR